MNIVSLIPARSSSKGIKNKNIKIIKNKPLIYYTIDVSLKSKFISDTFVSTDSLKIKKISEKFKAKVPFLRPKKYATDSASDYVVIYNFINNYEKIYNKKIDYLIYLRPTIPVRSIKLINKGIKNIINNPSFSSLRHVKEVDYHPYWMFKIENKILRSIIKNRGQQKFYRRQMLPKAYQCTGALDIINLKYQKKLNKSIYGDKILPFFESLQHIDIDTYEDLKKFKKLRNF